MECKIHKCQMAKKSLSVLGVDRVFDYCPECDKINAAPEKKKVDNLIDVPARYRTALIADYTNPKSYTLNESILITGTAGTGKTHMAIALARYALSLEDSYRVDSKFINFQSLTIKIKSSWKSESGSMDNILADCVKGFRIFDDIGTSKPTETACETLYMIANERYQNILPTIYTTNMTLAEIGASYGDRIASRLSDCRRIELKGEDRRLTRVAA